MKNIMTENRRNTEKKGINSTKIVREENVGRGKVREGIE
jgi:hypothetical protein